MSNITKIIIIKFESDDIQNKREYAVQTMRNKYQKFLSIRVSEKDIVLMRLRYQTILERGSTWAIPLQVYDYLYDHYDLQYEGFASPMNSRLLGRPNTKFCSIFYNNAN